MLVHHFLEKAASLWPDKTALVFGDQRLTYQEINGLSNRLAANLIGMGVKRRDRVVLLLDNSVESVIGIFGVLKAGAVFIMASATMKSRKFNFILKDSGAKVLITHTNKARVVKDSFADTPDLQNLIWCHGATFQTCLKSIASDLTSTSLVGRHLSGMRYQ